MESCEQFIDSERVKNQLEEFGWAIVPNVIPVSNCDEYITQINKWLSQFGSEFPRNIHSLIHQHNIGHLDPVWKTRVQAKPIFSALWKTEKLHTSTDGIAIGRPPELGTTTFEDEYSGVCELHLDQAPEKIGLHAYQGAVYLEEANKDDWSFMVIEKSHKLHQEFFQKHVHSKLDEFRKLASHEKDWYENQGCNIKRLDIPKGAIVLWDSRTVHAGAPAIRGRKNPRRWRYVVFVSMTPAIWASEEDLSQKTEAYRDLTLSRHWSSQGFEMFEKTNKHVLNITAMPESAQTKEVKLLVGEEVYNFEDGQPNGPEMKPVILD